MKALSPRGNLNDVVLSSAGESLYSSLSIKGLPHLIEMAAAIITGCDAFLTNDAQLAQVTELTVLVIDELERDDDSGAALP